VWLAELFDGVTRGHFDRLGVRAGSRCWEVGAGGPSIPEALAAAVGPTGYVLATDIDASWLTAVDGYDGHGFEVRRHDVAADRAADRQALGHPVAALRRKAVSAVPAALSDRRRAIRS